MGVSVIIASFNCEKYIDECLQSLFNQSYSGKIEIIVCDDCSTDGTSAILKRYAGEGRIVYLENSENKGAAASRNTGLKSATQDYIAILDADDYCHPDRFMIQTSCLEIHPEIDFVSSGLQKFYDNGVCKNFHPKKEKPTSHDFLFGLPFMHATTMFRKTILERVDGYRIAKETRRGQDYDLFMRIYAVGGHGLNIPDVLYFYRCFTGSSPKNKYKYRIDESIIRYKGFRAMKLGVIAIPFILKPLIVGLLPQKLIDKLAH